VTTTFDDQFGHDQIGHHDQLCHQIADLKLKTDSDKAIWMSEMECWKIFSILTFKGSLEKFNKFRRK